MHRRLPKLLILLGILVLLADVAQLGWLTTMPTKTALAGGPLPQLDSKSQEGSRQFEKKKM